MSGEVAEVARYLRRLEQRIAALERLEHGSGDMDINGLVVATPVSGDSVPIYDVSASANRKATISDILALSGGMNINGLTTNDTTSVNDSVPVYSAWYSANRKTTLGTIKALATNVDINGLTAASGGPTTSDSVVIYDASAYDNRKATLADIKPLMTSVDITGLTNATPAANDTVAIYDTSASGNRKATISDILALGGGSLDFDDIDSLSPIASLALDDTLAVYDESASAAGKATLQVVWDTIMLLDEVTILPTDYLAFVPDAGSTAYKTSVTDLSAMIFNDILSNDGSGSGFDADLLDGSHASAFAAASHSHDASAITTGTIDDARIPSGIARDSEVAAAYAAISHTHTTSAITDYEDGTWTPTLTFGGSAVGITYGTRVGTYVKIGKLVYITCTITLTSKGSSTGNAFVEGLPFNCNTTTNAQHRLTNFMDVPNGDISMASIGASQADRIALVRVTVATQAAAVMTNTQFSNTSRVWITGVYSTD
jgi:hypothetical protein